MELTTGDLLARAAELAAGPGRKILGITGPPGAGKSTLAELLVAELGPHRAALAPLDGFHIGDALLVEAGKRDRKGAPDTFDQAGYAAALARLRQADHVVYLPKFERHREDSTAAAIAVPPDVPLIVTEGNYLLVWPEVHDQLDQTWFLDVPTAERQERLVRRRIDLGADEALARYWAIGSDETNARTIAASRELADLVLVWRW
jgi:pantothenate kinase